LYGGSNFSQNIWLLEMVFSDIEDAVLSGRCDAGLIIHENRFTYQQKGLFKVADLGAGIPDAEKQKVFEKFYRVGDESKRTTKGTGLGLYLSTKIVKDHKGSVTIENNHPVGTVFKVILPKNRS
jgi:signal transduction histidine kinase